MPWRYVVVTENLVDEEFVKARCDVASFEKWRKFIAQDQHSPESQNPLLVFPPLN